MAFIKNPLKIDEKAALHHHAAFWYPLILFLTLGISLSIPLWCFCIPNPVDYKMVLDQLALPIFVSSIAIPFTISVARFHSSKQTARSISIAIENQSFSQFMDHKKYIEDFFESELLDSIAFHQYELKSKHNLYHFFFPENDINYVNKAMDDFEIYCERFFKIFEDEMLALSKSMKASAQKNYKTAPWHAVNNSSQFLIKFGMGVKLDSNSQENMSPNFNYFYSLLGYSVVNILFDVWFALSKSELNNREIYAIKSNQTERLAGIVERFELENLYNKTVAGKGVHTS